MIVSYSKSFAFLHSRKTGGSSLTIALSKILDEEDVLIIDAPTLKNFVECNVVPRGFFCDRNIKILYNEGFRDSARVMEVVCSASSFHGHWRKGYENKIISDFMRTTAHTKNQSQHAGVKFLREEHGDVFDYLFKFSFERNPWDRMISLYNWRWRGQKDKPSFPAFIWSLERSDSEQLAHRSYKRRNFPIYSEKGKVAVDYVGQYEKYIECVRNIELKLNVDIVQELPEVKKIGKPVVEFYSREMDGVIQRVFREEIDVHSYVKPTILC